MAAEGAREGGAEDSRRSTDDGETPTDMEEERETLRRQIQQLQGLISQHKHIHGNAPAPAAPAHPRWRDPLQLQYRPRGSFRGGAPITGYQPRQPHPHSTWRAQYSLVNRTSRGAEHSAPSPVVVPSVTPASLLNKGKFPAHNNAAKSEPASRQTVPGNPTVINNNNNKTLAVPKAKCPPSASAQKPLSDEAAVPSTSAEWGVRLRKNPPGAPGGPCRTSAQVPRTSQNLSNTTRGSAGTLPSSNRLPLPHLKPAIASPPPNSMTTAKNKLVPPNPSPNPPKTTLPAVPPTRALRSSRTKYTWVAESPKTTPSAKKVSPGAKRASAGTEKVKSPANGNGSKPKKNSPHQKCTPKNRYKWKAQPSAAASSAPAASSQTAITRSAQRTQTPETTRSPHGVGGAAAASYRDSGNSGYKVKSRTKIVRRRSTSRSPVEKKASPLLPLTVKSRYVLRRKSAPRVKSPVTVKRSSPRALVHLSKHRLRRLPPTKTQSPAARDGISSSMKSPPVSRVIKTRYRIVKKSSTPLISSTFSTLNPSIYWRNRVLLWNRWRQLSHVRRAHPQQRWKKSLRCIEGAIYQVSANKLSRAWSPGAASKSTHKTGKADVSSTSPSNLHSNRTATPTQYFASRAVQRSLAIIRQAQQKKAKKEYCMYYNRFGRCKRGDSCPFIHDPEKVAVCTMFLRGTCKLTDGTCPFSHKASKDKMPVCSFFLKGSCHKTDCPYSHVYVSRKAEVCPDFLKGYCPMGAKCKKKHTLLCPHYARNGTCPDGAKCKLQHRQKKRRVESQTPEHPPPISKQRRKSKEDSGDQPRAEGPGNVSSCDDGHSDDCRGLISCPSFISLGSSHSSEPAPSSDRRKPAEDTGKPLQIKPRL
ncbi:zinc finger CCCH domain-containing protein 3 isoform X2 [Rana temporaria]|uniref:zinc finger CCCH domain-containing protein 3 isoform X2 n=1 Tax=Rana temporaria TaxID=8407 RepID=UPI001AAC52AC|nr:zinc finger CCCH domain-containing protein 3 isoform X2 [Rana temporaria]